MREVLASLTVWGERGDRIALATVTGVSRSAPRPPGAKMAISARGEIAGSVSGGCVEGAVVEIAERVLAGEPPSLTHFGIADAAAWDIGLPCGGEIDVWVQEHVPATGEVIPCQQQLGGRQVCDPTSSRPDQRRAREALCSAPIGSADP
jgi:xanthine dehydrogenase accessory factor